jgi:uncharacterized protein YbjQ (UPF0145 family)
MAKRDLRWLALAALALPLAAAAVEADQVVIHESVTSAPARYEVIKRLWVGSWVSAFTVPTYRSREQAEAAFRGHAARLGGNGVINFGCYNRVISPNPPPGSPLNCNGTVVRFQ